MCVCLPHLEGVTGGFAVRDGGLERETEDGRRRKVKKNVSAMTRQLYHSEAVITAC